MNKRDRKFERKQQNALSTILLKVPPSPLDNEYDGYNKEQAGHKEYESGPEENHSGLKIEYVGTDKLPRVDFDIPKGELARHVQSSAERRRTM